MGDDRIRDPQRDKELSLSRDCRNSYGESRHAARKAIPRRKQLAHKATRAAVRRDLSAYERLDAEGQDVVESSARNDTHSVGSWRKEPDAPLGVMIERQARLRARDDGKMTQQEYLGLPFIINEDVREAKTRFK
jgi:hypothetical protein